MLPVGRRIGDGSSIRRVGKKKLLDDAGRSQGDLRRIPEDVDELVGPEVERTSTTCEVVKTVHSRRRIGGRIPYEGAQT